MNSVFLICTIVALNFDFVHGQFAITLEHFQCFFPDRSDITTQYEAFQRASSSTGLNVSSEYEAAALFGSIDLFTRGLQSFSPACNDPSRVSQCAQSFSDPCPWNCSIVPAPGQKYYGRGALHLAYPCNYKLMSEHYNDPSIFSNPNSLQEDIDKAWLVAAFVWLLKTPEASDSLWARSCHEYVAERNFGRCLARINGSECRTGGEAAQQAHVQAINRIATECLNQSDLPHLTCRLSDIAEPTACSGSKTPTGGSSNRSSSSFGGASAHRPAFQALIAFIVVITMFVLM